MTISNTTNTEKTLQAFIQSTGTGIRLAGKNVFVHAYAVVQVRDGSSQLVEGATVVGNWSDAVSGMTTGVPDSSGRVTLTSPEAKAPKTKNTGLLFILSVVDVQLTGYTYGGGEPAAEIQWWP